MRGGPPLFGYPSAEELQEKLLWEQKSSLFHEILDTPIVKGGGFDTPIVRGGLFGYLSAEELQKKLLWEQNHHFHEILDTPRVRGGLDTPRVRGGAFPGTFPRRSSRKTAVGTKTIISMKSSTPR